MNTRLIAEWSALNEVTGSQTDELIKDKLVRIISVEFAQTLRNICIPESAKFSEKTISPLLQGILDTRALSETLLSKIISLVELLLVRIPDAGCQRISLDLLQWLIPNILKQQHLLDLLIGQTLSILLTALAHLDSQIEPLAIVAIDKIIVAPILQVHLPQMEFAIQSICKLTPAQVRDLIKAMKSSETEKGRRNQLKYHLRNWIGVRHIFFMM